MNEIVKIENIQDLILELRDESVLLDKDVAQIYGVETKRINEAVKNNFEKFPNDYLFETTNEEFEILRSKFSTTKLTKTRVNPKVFTEPSMLDTNM